MWSINRTASIERGYFGNTAPKLKAYSSERHGRQGKALGRSDASCFDRSALNNQCAGGGGAVFGGRRMMKGSGIRTKVTATIIQITST